jgi:hypothetical protein
MAQDLIMQREEVMVRADRALDAAWPTRTGDAYVREMQWAVGELEKIAKEMQSRNYDRVEQSRTYRILGSIYADLEPALGKEMLLKARKAYQTAEILLVGQSDDLERAKLNFNFGNTLRQIDPNNIEQLHEAKLRLLGARTYFAANATQHLTQTDAALQSVESLLTIAPLANAVKHNTDEMAALQEALAAGGNISEIAKKAQEVMKLGGGVAGMAGQVKGILEGLSPELQKDPRFSAVQQQMEALAKKALGRKSPDPGSEENKLLGLLKERLQAELKGSKVTDDRAETLRGILENFGGLLSGENEDKHAMMEKLNKMRNSIEGMLEIVRYPSHGVPRPSAGSRAADLVELHWQLRRYLLEEMNRPNKGEEESKEALALNIRAGNADKRIYEAGNDDAKAMEVDKEVLRPLACDVRTFSARMHAMPAQPIWRIAKTAVDTSAVIYSGPSSLMSPAAAACHMLGLQIMPEPRGESYATARWKQLQKSMTAVFDLRAVEGAARAAVTYELGIALTIGKPVVVLVGRDEALPFDVDVDPVVLAGEKNDSVDIASAIDRAVYSVYSKTQDAAHQGTLEYLLAQYRRPQKNVYADQTLQMLIELRKEPDPLAVTSTMVTFFNYLNDGRTMIIQPVWTPAYPEKGNPRLFHVMPFSPKWADRVTETTRETCEAAGVTYVRGDEVDEPNVIRSIWEEIARATHVLVDLTGFNANVALELGIAHTLGKKILMVGQEKTVDNLFSSIRKLRVKEYSVKQLKRSLSAGIKDFITS